MGFRGDYLETPKPINEFRIFMIGGSTTECFYLDNSQSINAVLQQYLQYHVSFETSIKVYNSGKSGDASDDHISMLAHRIIHLDPDMIIVFSGINDLTRSIYNYDYLHYMKLSSKKYSPILLLQFFSTEFHIPRRLYYLLKKVSKTDQEIIQEITLKSDYRSKVELRKSSPISDEKPVVDIRSYKNNLETIAGIARFHKIQLVFITQQTTWNSSVDTNAQYWHWILYRNGKTYREEFMDEALESLNDIMRQISIENSITIYDLVKLIPKSLEFFYDDVHFNVKGASVTGNELGKYIIQSSLIR
jgi:lysophospholipase L1-like esterase